MHNIEEHIQIGIGTNGVYSETYPIEHKIIEFNLNTKKGVILHYDDDWENETQYSCITDKQQLSELLNKALNAYNRITINICSDVLQ